MSDPALRMIPTSYLHVEHLEPYKHEGSDRPQRYRGVSEGPSLERDTEIPLADFIEEMLMEGGKADRHSARAGAIGLTTRLTRHPRRSANSFDLLSSNSDACVAS